MRNPRGTTIAILQARTGSSRLPGKVLLPLGGSPMILRQLERIGRATSIDQIVVATSEDPSDDELARTVAAAGYDIVRGPLDDVLARFVIAADEHHPDVIVRLTGDCPLVCPEVIDEVVTTFHDSVADYMSNTLAPTYPDGLDVEVMSTHAIRRIETLSTDPDEREHVTLGIYRRFEEFAVENYANPSGIDHSDLRWTVDTSEDYEFVMHVYEYCAARNSKFDYDDILAYLDQNPGLSRTRRHAARNAALDGIDTGAMRHPGNGS